LVSAIDSIDVPIGFKHRISCGTFQPLILIEIQTGLSLDEEDILRFEDDFGRLANNFS
jgi:mannose-1-phosphate guanylyltransferase/mannose-6-phosphate isomerase